MPSDATGSSHQDERQSFQLPSAPSMSREELRALVCEWTRTLKEQGLPPERVLAIVKSRVRDLILPHVTQYSDTDARDPRVDRLMSDSSQWCIASLFDPSDK